MMTSKSVISDNHPVLIYYDIMTRKRIVQRLQDVSPSIKLLSLSFKKIDKYVPVVTPEYYQSAEQLFSQKRHNKG